MIRKHVPPEDFYKLRPTLTSVGAAASLMKSSSSELEPDVVVPE